MLRPNLMDAEAAPQPLSLSNFAAAPSANGFDFGLSQPKVGLGYGLLGDRRSLEASQPCSDCPPTDACPNCSIDAGSTADPQGKMIKAQYPVPMPEFIPPPPVGMQPGRPTQTPIIGDPHAFWNWTLNDWGDWIKDRADAKSSQAIEEMCEEEYALDTINCNIKKAYAGADAARVCHEQAFKAYADCLRKGKKSDIPRYDRN